MYIYELTYSTPGEGVKTRFVRNRRTSNSTRARWKREHPEREILIDDRVEVPETKDELVEWLNERLGDKR